MTAAEIIAFNRGVRAVIGLADDVGEAIGTEIEAAGASDASSVARMHRVVDEFARQAAVLLMPEPIGEPATEED